MATTLTAAQTARLALVRKDVAKTGTRITTRKLAGGFVRITEHVKGGGKDSVVMAPDGLYVDSDQAPAAEVVEGDEVTEDVSALLLATIMTGLTADVRQEFLDLLTPEEHLVLESAVEAGRGLWAQHACQAA